jgi:MoaA/NifB/PqqE/SkfB family radical SAM enzyme
MAHGHFKRKAFSRRTDLEAPLVIMISPTSRCNLRCEGCYASAVKDGPELSFEEVDEVIRQAREIGIYFVVLSGGEPFIWPGLFELVEKYQDMIFMIYTNGTCITAENARRLASLGNCSPAVSLEGGQKETDRRRGDGVYRRIEESFAHLREAKALYGFSATVSKNNFNAIAADRFREKQIERGCVYGWIFHYVPVGRDATTEWMLTPDQRLALYRVTQRWRLLDKIMIADFWNDGPLVGGCLAGGRRYFHVNACGDVEPCAFLRFATHNIRNSTLEEALASSFFTRIQACQKTHDNLLQPCFLIDYPAELKEIVADVKARSTDGFSQDVVTRCCRDLSERSQKYRQLADPEWNAFDPGRLGAFKHWVEEG